MMIQRVLSQTSVMYTSLPLLDSAIPVSYTHLYFSREKITDLDEDLIATTITEDDLTKVSRQLDVSMGEMFQLINVFAVVLFALLIYLLTKLIIEKNANAISMVKILGYENREINSLYLTSTTWVVILSILLSLLLSTWTIYGIYEMCIRDRFTSKEAEEFFHTEKLLQLLREHKEGKKDNSRKIWTVLALSLIHI